MASSYIDKGTLITVEDGSKVAIENLNVGDKVQSYDMRDMDFDMCHIGNSEQQAFSIVDITTETIPGEDVHKLSLDNGSKLSVAGSTLLYSADEQKGILQFGSDGEVPGTEDVSEGSLIYVDDGENLNDIVLESIESWSRPREMCSIWIEGGNSVFANEVLVSVNRKLTEKEEETADKLRLENQTNDPEEKAIEEAVEEAE